MNSMSPAAATVGQARCIALVGNPNVGKTSLFNRLTNLLAKTSNFPGTTVELRTALLRLTDQDVRLIDLPGVYSLVATSPEEEVTSGFLHGENERYGTPDGIVIVVDATQLARTLFVVGQAKELRIPMVVAVGMSDVAAKQGPKIDFGLLAQRIGCPVIPISARSGEGLDKLRTAMAALVVPSELSDGLPVLDDEACDTCGSCPYADGYRWSTTLAREVTEDRPQSASRFTEITDRFVTHPIFGPVVFAAVMLALFTSIFRFAQWPMEVVDSGVGFLAEQVGRWIPAGDIHSLVTDGIIGGAGSVLVFLPQVCVLFFVLSLLEDSGYLARAVVVVDSWMRRVGLPGQAFVPLLAAHACAIPAIMSTRVIENRRDRLAAILVIPLMTCSARLPVYAMVAAMLFPGNALYAALLFASAYGLGMVAAFSLAWILRMSILPGEPSPLILQLPAYRRPSLRSAFRHSWDRGVAFVRDAGLVILAVSIGIWALSTYPKIDPNTLQQRVAALQTEVWQEAAPVDSVALEMQIAQEHSLLGRMGKAIQPVFAPLGFDWKTSVGVLSSFAAREVVVSTLSVLYGAGEDTDTLISRVSNAKRPDGTPAFDTATSISLLVFFVLAMQCLPTQAVTRKETGSWKWPVFQLVSMTLMAYGAAFVAKHICHLLVG